MRGGLLSSGKPCRVPKIPELFDCRRGVARVMVVGIGEDDYAAFPDLIAKIDPTAEFSYAINNGLVPEDEASASSWR
jgi:hypothetical protein